MKATLLVRISTLKLCIPILTFAISGCVNASVAAYPNAHFAPTNPQEVAVYTNFPPVEYEVIGEVEASGAPAADWQSVSNRMRSEAAKIGGDAVIILVQDTPYRGSINSPGRITGQTNSYAYATGTGNFASGWGTSNSSYNYSPPTSTPMYGKYAKGVVIRYLQRAEPELEDSNRPPTPEEKTIIADHLKELGINPQIIESNSSQDDSSGSILYESKTSDGLVAHLDVAKVFDSYQKTVDVDAYLRNLGREMEAQREIKVDEIQSLKANGAQTFIISEKVDSLKSFDSSAKTILGAIRNAAVIDIFADIDKTVKGFAEQNNTNKVVRSDVSTNGRNITDQITGMLNSTYGGRASAEPIQQDSHESVISQLERLADLKAKGFLSDEEFEMQKKKLLDG